MSSPAENVSEYLRLLNDRYPNFSKGAIIIVNIGGKINRHYIDNGVN